MKLLCLSLLVAGIVQAQFTPETMMKPEAYTNETGEVLKYRVWAPQFPKPGEKYPLILFLHGSGECGTDNVKQIRIGLPAMLAGMLKENRQAIVVAPQCQMGAMGSWVHRLAFQENYAADKEPAAALARALEICSHLMAARQGDPDRFYITGLSLGGFGTWDAIQRQPGLFAAAAPLSGGGDIRMVRGLSKLPIWVAHGSADKNVPVICSRRMVAALRQNGNRHVVYQEFENAPHDVWSRVYGNPDFLAWLFKQNRKPKPWWKFWE